MRIHRNARDWQTRFRLWAAIIMACYVVSHTINFSLGLISIDAMNAYQNAVLKFWRSQTMYWVVLTAILVHVSLGVWKLIRRNTLKMPLWEAAQIILGLCIPFFVLAHITFTRGMFHFFQVHDNYTYILLRSFPYDALQYIAMVLIVWAHAQIGVHVVLRMRPWYKYLKYVIILVFVSLPLLGVAGYVRSGEEAVKLSRDSAWLEANKKNINWPSEDQIKLMSMVSMSYYFILPPVYLLILGIRSFKLWRLNKKKTAQVVYQTGASVKVFPRTTILEASRLGNIPHASICGGRGRCTTCRVRLEEGFDAISAVGDREEKALKRIGAMGNVRLACQCEVLGNIRVTQLLPADVKPGDARAETALSVGKEVEMVVMFADIRGFTSFSEKKFPYDVVFILNRYFQSMGEIVDQHGGKIDKFIGDGILAIFGQMGGDLTKASRNALLAANAMFKKLTDINHLLKNDLPSPLEMGIGMHIGPVVLGEMGYKYATSLTVIGDTVNTASRLEGLNKKANSRLIVTKNLIDRSGYDFGAMKTTQVLVRGKSDPLLVYIFKDIDKELDPLIMSRPAKKG